MRSKTETDYLYIWINKGTSSETVEKKGLAHLAEHMIFRARNSQGEILVEKLFKLRLKMNAYTSHNYTVIVISGDKSHLKATKQTLTQILYNPQFNDCDFEKEKIVVLNEIRETIDPFQMSLWKVFEKQQSTYWGYDLRGDTTVIKKANLNTVLKYMKNTFSERNSTFVHGESGLLNLKKTRSIQPFKKKVKSMDSIFDKKNNFGHVLVKLNNLYDYGSFLIFREIIKNKGYISTLIFNKNVQIGTISKRGERIKIKLLKKIFSNLSLSEFNTEKQKLSLNFARDFNTGNHLFHEAEWKMEFGQHVSYKNFTHFFESIDFKQFHEGLSRLLNPSALNHPFTFNQKKLAQDLTEKKMFCFSLVIPFGYLNETPKMTGQSYVISEILEYRFTQHFPDVKANFIPELGHDHYGITIWGEGESTNLEKKCYDLFINLNTSQEEAILFAALLNLKKSRLLSTERFEIACDSKYYKSLGLNCKRYPRTIFKPKQILEFINQHNKLSRQTIRTKVSQSYKTNARNFHHKHLAPRIFKSKTKGLCDYLCYVPIPNDLNNLEGLLSVSSYVNREEFKLYQILKYDEGLTYSYRARIQKVKGRLYIKIKIKSDSSNHKKIKRTIEGYQFIDEISLIKCYRFKSRDIFSESKKNLIKRLI